MGYDDQNDFYEDPNVAKSKIKFSNQDYVVEKKCSPKHKKQKTRRDDNVVEHPTNIKWLIFGCVVVALLFSFLTSWTSAPKQDVVEANHLQRAKYRKVKVVSEQNREARGFSRSY